MTQHDHLELVKQVLDELRTEFQQTNEVITGMATKADIAWIAARLGIHRL